MSVVLPALIAAGTGLQAFGMYKAGAAAKRAGQVNAKSIKDISEENASLILEGAELNAGVYEFNAKALEYQATDAVTRGKELETRFRQQLKGLIGTQRAGFAAQGLDISSGSPLDVQEDTAYQGELDALTIRTSAAREAWGYSTVATGERLQAGNLRKLSKLQAKNVREVGRMQAYNALQGGNLAASQANWGVASTILTGATNVAMIKRYG